MESIGNQLMTIVTRAGPGPAWRQANAGHVSLDQLKVMSAIESCRTAAPGGHVARCEDCAHTVIAYNSCRNRHCPKCVACSATHGTCRLNFRVSACEGISAAN
jgi:hypothetical protein